MLWDYFAYFGLFFITGFLVGIEVTRYYNEKVNRYSLGKIIQGVLISKSVSELSEYNNQIDVLVQKMKSSSDILSKQLKRGEDIEKNDFVTFQIDYESKEEKEIHE